MSKWKPTPMRRSLKPAAEGLETRELSRSAGREPVPKGVPTQAATAVVRGMDPDGASGRCALWARGAQRRRDQRRRLHSRRPARCRNRSTPSPSRGRSRPQTRLVARVYPNPDTNNAKVFFQNLIVTPTGELGKIDVGQVSNFRTVANGILADRHARLLSGSYRDDQAERPHRRSTPSAMSAGEIYIPQGVITLRFGGVDVNYVPPGGVALNHDRAEQRVPDQLSACRSFRGRASSSIPSTATARPTPQPGSPAVPGLRDLPRHRPAQSLPGQRNRRQHDLGAGPDSAGQRAVDLPALRREART